MNIGIDARWIFKELSGIGVYTRELIRALAGADSENRYILFFDNEKLKERILDETGACKAANFSAHILPFGLFSIGNQWRMPRVLREQDIDVYHSTNYMIPLTAFPANRPGKIRCVTTIHDLIPLIFPEYAPRSKKRRFFPIYRFIMNQSAARSDVIITDSESSRTDVLSHLRIAPARQDRVIAIPVGIAPIFRPADNREVENNTEKDDIPALDKERGHEKTVLWVGRPDPYKNLVGLIEAFAIARRVLPFPIRLRIAGPRDNRYPEAFKAAAHLGVQDAIDRLGYIPDEQLVREYRNADLLALPSRYEGFGLPAVEAMACGTPVICSDKGSLPEVAGAAAIMVPPDDIIGMSEAIMRVLSDPELAGDMIKKGLRHAARYTWRTTAEKTMQAYRKAME